MHVGLLGYFHQRELRYTCTTTKQICVSFFLHWRSPFVTALILVNIHVTVHTDPSHFGIFCYMQDDFFFVPFKKEADYFDDCLEQVISS